MIIKLRDLNEEQYIKWQNENCKGFACDKCIFKKVACGLNRTDCWFRNRELYNDKFLDQEIEIEGEILTEKEREYLSNVIKPFRTDIDYIKKSDYFYEGEYYIVIIVRGLTLEFPHFKNNKYYKNMKINKKYTLEELGL